MVWRFVTPFLHKILINNRLHFTPQVSPSKVCASGGSTNYWTKPLECQIVANLDSLFSVTLLKHFCQSVSFYFQRWGVFLSQLAS